MNGREEMPLAEQDSQENEAFWAWFKALDAATDTARAKTHATLSSSRADSARTAGRDTRGRVARDEQNTVRGDIAAVCL
jgi:hypothetical protein